MFETLIKKANTKMAEIQFKLALCNDVYRLHQIMKDAQGAFLNLSMDAWELVGEIKTVCNCNQCLAERSELNDV